MKKLTLVVLLLFLMVACSPLQVRHAVLEHNSLAPGTSFASYRLLPAPSGAFSLQPAYRTALQDAVKKELAQRQMEQAEAAEVEVRAYISRRQEQRRAAKGYQVGAVSRKTSSKAPETMALQVATLTIELSKPGSGQLLWRGTVSTEINRALNSEQSRQKIANAVGAVFALLHR